MTFCCPDGQIVLNIDQVRKFQKLQFFKECVQLELDDQIDFDAPKSICQNIVEFICDNIKPDLTKINDIKNLLHYSKFYKIEKLQNLIMQFIEKKFNQYRRKKEENRILKNKIDEINCKYNDIYNKYIQLLNKTVPPLCRDCHLYLLDKLKIYRYGQNNSTGIIIRTDLDLEDYPDFCKKYNLIFKTELSGYYTNNYDVIENLNISEKNIGTILKKNLKISKEYRAK